MPYYYNPLMLSNYTPVFTPQPVPAISSATEAPLVCVQMSAALVPYLVGLLEIYRWKDRFIGTEEQVQTALGVIQDLVVLLTEGNCPECVENAMPASFRFTETCGLEYTNDNGTTWYDVPGWSTFASLCFQGPPGADGQDGAQGLQGIQGLPGAQGPKGDKGDKGDNGICETCGDNPPIGETANDDNICGMGNYLIDMLTALNDEVVSQATAGLSTFEIGVAIGSFFSGIVGFLLADFISAVKATSLSAYEASFTVQAIEDMKCDMYNVLRNSGGAFSSPATWDAWKTRHRARGFNAFFEIFYGSISARENDWWNSRAAIGALDPNPYCAVCTTDDQRTIGWELVSATVNESSTVKTFRLKLTSPDNLPSPVTVNIVGVDGTATSAAGDYALVTTQVTFAAGSVPNTYVDVQVNIPIDSDTSEEAFTLRIDSVVGVAVLDATRQDLAITINGVAAWCFNFDFTASNGGFTAVSGLGAYVAGVGWRGVDPAGGSVIYAANINRNYAATTITKIEIVVNVPGGLTAAANMGVFNGGTVLANPDLILGINTYTWIGSQASTNFRINPNDTTQNFTVLSVKFFGEGTNPFGADNC